VYVSAEGRVEEMGTHEDKAVADPERGAPGARGLLSSSTQTPTARPTRRSR